MSNYLILTATCKEVKSYKKDANSKERFITDFVIPCSDDVIDVLTDDNRYIEGMQYCIMLEANKFGMRAKVVCPYQE